MRKMTTDERIAATSSQIECLLMERLDGPKDAAKALLIAHVKLTLDQGFDRRAVEGMLDEYRQLFHKAYFGTTH